MTGCSHKIALLLQRLANVFGEESDDNALRYLVRSTTAFSATSTRLLRHRFELVHAAAMSLNDAAGNGVAENVFGTTDQSASFLLACFKFTCYSRAAELTRGPSRYPSSYRCHLLDCIAHPTAIQNLAHQVYQRALTLARESRPSASGPFPLRTCTCVFPSNHIPSLAR